MEDAALDRVSFLQLQDAFDVIGSRVERRQAHDESVHVLLADHLVWLEENAIEKALAPHKSHSSTT
eukprot:scaffold4601_cov146-Ochromonas_danica.AAC.4